MKTALIALLAVGVAGAAYAQNAQMPTGPTNPPPGTSYGGAGNNPYLPPSTTGTAKPGALNSNASSAEAATRYKFEQAGFHDVKGLSRTPDGVWSGRAVRNGVEVAVSMDAAGNIGIVQ
jgi:hypothetical protein